MRSIYRRTKGGKRSLCSPTVIRRFQNILQSFTNRHNAPLSQYYYNHFINAERLILISLTGVQSGHHIPVRGLSLAFQSYGNFVGWKLLLHKINELWPQGTGLDDWNVASCTWQVTPTSSVAFMMLYSTGPVSQEKFGYSRHGSGVLSDADLGADPGAHTLRQNSPFTSLWMTTKSKQNVQDCTVVSVKLLRAKAESHHL